MTGRILASLYDKFKYISGHGSILVWGQTLYLATIGGYPLPDTPRFAQETCRSDKTRPQTKMLPAVTLGIALYSIFAVPPRPDGVGASASVTFAAALVSLPNLLGQCRPRAAMPGVRADHHARRLRRRRAHGLNQTLYNMTFWYDNGGNAS